MNLVLENGSENIRYGVAGGECKSILNGIVRGKGKRRNIIGSSVESLNDISSLLYKRAFERGYTCDWSTEKIIWQHIFSSAEMNVHNSLRDCNLLLSQPFFAPRALSRLATQICFEEFEFNSICKKPAPFLALTHFLSDSSAAACVDDNDNNSDVDDLPTCVGSSSSSPIDGGTGIVLDVGHSSVRAVPFFDGHALNYAVRRLDIGGKALTNHLKEVTSYRQYHVMDETYLMDVVKRRLCYVSQNFGADMATSRLASSANTVRRAYVLPDGVDNRLGYVFDERSDTADADVAAQRQLLIMNSERFTVPELLFNPSDIGIRQAGVDELVQQAINATAAELRAPLYANIMVTGGSSLFDGFVPRLRRQLRSLAPIDHAVRIYHSSQPLDAAWLGGSLFAQRDDFAQRCVTRAQYLEYGSGSERLFSAIFNSQ
jgi:actin-related protein 6